MHQGEDHYTASTHQADVTARINISIREQSLVMGTYVSMLDTRSKIHRYPHDHRYNDTSPDLLTSCQWMLLDNGVPAQLRGPSMLILTVIRDKGLMSLCFRDIFQPRRSSILNAAMLCMNEHFMACYRLVIWRFTNDQARIYYSSWNVRPRRNTNLYQSCQVWS